MGFRDRRSRRLCGADMDSMTAAILCTVCICLAIAFLLWLIP
jgi:hypothetical protein